MSRIKAIILSIVVLIVSLVIFIFYFFSTGGRGLARTVVYYLFSDMPDKQYTWIDFINKNGPGSNVSGFYAFGDENSISIWTLSGLKRFYAKPLSSVYVFRDTCGIIKQMKENQTKNMVNPEQTTIEISEWQTKMKSEYFVTVKVLDREDGRNMIDKAWGVSGRYKILGKVEAGVCD